MQPPAEAVALAALHCTAPAGCNRRSDSAASKNSARLRSRVSHAYARLIPTKTAGRATRLRPPATRKARRLEGSTEVGGTGELHRGGSGREAVSGGEASVEGTCGYNEKYRVCERRVQGGKVGRAG